MTHDVIAKSMAEATIHAPHNAEETPLFAWDIEHKALAERWDR